MYVFLGRMNDHKQRNLVTSGIINIISFRANQSLIIYRIQLNDVIVLPLSRRFSFYPEHILVS
jgi:hypothetical protein